MSDNLDELREVDKCIIREIQQDIPLISRPFKKIAEKIGVTEEEIIEKLNLYKERGYVRRFGAALRHREMGLTANPMIVMRVADDIIEEVGKQVASFSQVTHCYQRIPQPEFPFNLFAMIHCPTKAECEELAEIIIESVDVAEHKLLYSTQELKKTSMKYFIDE